MSTTTDVSVAISYAVKKDTRSALLFRFVTRNKLERGADVQLLSMFPGESEKLFPPLTFLHRTRSEPQDAEHNCVKVTIVELSARHPTHHRNGDTIIQSAGGCSTRPYTRARSRCRLSVSCSSALCGGRCSRRRLAMTLVRISCC
jgi:hypothetical protein